MAKYGRYEPSKGDYAGGAVRVLEMFEKGQLGYPEVTLKLAGLEANASRAHDVGTKEAIHKIVQLISTEMKPYRKRGEGFKSQPIPAEVIEKIKNNPVYQQAKAYLASPATQVRNIEREAMLSKAEKKLAKQLA